MDLERREFSSSDLLSSSAEDQMVRIELEAAEALADLAHLAMRESAGRDSAGKWGSKGKRAKKRVKSEYPPADLSLNPVVDQLPTCPDLAMDRVVVEPEQGGEPIYRNLVINPTKVEPDADLAKQTSSCARNYPLCGGGRSRLNLSEAEKEERRLRRILANRESARQTIRRRQALCEELTRKAADLTWENENLKREKELALKEYRSLEITNKCLKAQMATVKTVEECPGDLKPATLATNCPLFFYNHSTFSPLCWPSIIQSSNAVQSHCGPQNAVVVPSNMPVQANGRLDLSHQQQENLMNINGPRAPLFIVSCPWFFSAADHGNGLHPSPSFCSKHRQDCTSVNCGLSSSRRAALAKSRFLSMPVEVKSETASSTGVRIHDRNETTVGFPLEGGGSTGPQPKEMILTTVPLSSVTPAVAVKNETGPRLEYEYASSRSGICTKGSQLISPLLEKNQDPSKFPSKKLVDAAAATEARRRRKELTKLKNLNGRQCRMNC